MTEKILQANLEELGIERVNYMAWDEWTSFGDVDFPTFLITEETFREKTAKALGLDLSVQDELREGADKTDAGDTHGQYHNEAEWYRIQRLEIQTKVADTLKEGLDRAVVVSDYEVVREAIKEKGLDPGMHVTLGSRVKIQYGDDPEDTEEIMIVSKLDSKAQPGWVSVETPLAKALQRKVKGDRVSFNPSEKPSANTPKIEVKVLEIA